MAKEKPIEEITQPEGAVSQTPEEDAWVAGMEQKYPEAKGNREAMFKASREGYDKEHELNKKNAQDYERIYEGIQRSPEVAGFVNRLTHPEDGEEPEEAYAEFGEDLVDLLTGKIDNKTYRDAKARKKAEADEKAKAEADTAEAAGKAYVEACESLGMDPKEAMGQLNAKYGNGGDEPDFRMSKEFYVALLKSLSYDDDMLAAEARGRNAQMKERNGRRGAASDGLPHSGSAGGAAKSADPNSLASVYARRAAMNR